MQIRLQGSQNNGKLGDIRLVSGVSEGLDELEAGLSRCFGRLFRSIHDFLIDSENMSVLGVGGNCVLSSIVAAVQSSDGVLLG